VGKLQEKRTKHLQKEVQEVAGLQEEVEGLQEVAGPQEEVAEHPQKLGEQRTSCHPGQHRTSCPCLH